MRAEKQPISKQADVLPPVRGPFKSQQLSAYAKRGKPIPVIGWLMNGTTTLLDGVVDDQPNHHNLADCGRYRAPSQTNVRCGRGVASMIIATLYRAHCKRRTKAEDIVSDIVERLLLNHVLAVEFRYRLWIRPALSFVRG
jgi:hypothetical protein